MKWMIGHNSTVYSPISINSAGPVICDGPAEILVLVTSQSCRDMPKIFYISHMITKWIRHTMKIAVTIVTFQHFEVPCDAWLLNWMKWYSMYSFVKMWWSSVDSSGLQWTPVDSGDTFVSPLSFLWVFHRSPPESTGVHRSPLEFTGVQWYKGGGGKVLHTAPCTYWPESCPSCPGWEKSLPPTTPTLPKSCG